MLKVWKILVTALALAGCAAVMTGCGQKGPLVLPTSPESAGRATLPQTLNPWRATPQTPAPRPAAPQPPETSPRP